MRLYFTTKTNSKIPYINGAVLRINGNEVFVDRDSTLYSYEELEDGFYEMSMDWRDCYIWDDDGAHYLRDLDTDMTVEFVSFDLEDDAEYELGKEYFVDLISFEI